MLNNKFLSLLFIVVTALSLRDPSSMIFYSNLTSPFQQTIRVYGNYDFKVNSFNFTGANEKKAAQTAIQSFITYYGRTQFPKQAQYSFQYYQDSSLSAVAYILYKKSSITSATRYYSLRMREGTRRGTVYQLGSDDCPNCMIGKQLLFAYQQYTDAKINQMGQDIANIVNSINIKNTKIQASSIKDLKAWNFPKGKLIIANISSPSSPFIDILVPMLNTPEQYLLYLNAYSIPKVCGNLPIDFGYISGYMFRIAQVLNLNNTSQPYPRTFEYILDENFKNTITFSYRYGSQQITGVIKLYNGATGSTFPSPHDIYLHPGIYIKGQTFTPYFDYNDPQPKIGSSATSQKQSRQLQSYLTNKLNYPISFIDFMYIDFATNRRQYNLVYNDTITGDIIQAIVISNRSINNSYGYIYKRVALPNQTNIDNKDVRSNYWNLYEISDYYGMSNYNLNYSFTPAEISAAEICSFSSQKFEIGMIYNSNPSRRGSKDYCMSHKVFIKNLQSNRINFLGQSIVSSSQCTYFGLKAFITYSCPLNQPTEVSQATKSLIFQKLGNKLIDNKGVVFSQSLLTTFIGFGLQLLGIGELYYAEFNKDGVYSYFLIQQSNSQYIILDNMEGTTSSNYPNLLAGPNNSSNSTNSQTNNTSNGPSSPTLIVEQNSALMSIGNGQLPIQFIANQYQAIINLIRKNTDSTNIGSKPTIFYYIDESINFSAFAVLFQYVYSVFEVYQIVKLLNNNQYYFMGKKYIPKIPETYWLQASIPQSSSSQILSQVAPIINENAACFNVPMRSFKISNLAMINGGFYTINAQMMNGYNASIGLFRNDMKWIKVYSQLKSYQGENMNSKAVMVLMTKSQTDNDSNFKQSLGLLSKQLSPYGNLPISKIEKGIFANGTIQYQITFDQSPTNKVAVIFLYDPSSKKILYLDNSSTSSLKQPSANPSQYQQALPKILQFLTQKYTIIKDYQSIKTQVNYIQGSILFNLKIKALDKNTYNADVILTAPSTPNEKISIISFYRQL